MTAAFDLRIFIDHQHRRLWQPKAAASATQLVPLTLCICFQTSADLCPHRQFNGSIQRQFADADSNPSMPTNITERMNQQF